MPKPFFHFLDPILEPSTYVYVRPVANSDLAQPLLTQPPPQLFCIPSTSFVSRITSPCCAFSSPGDLSSNGEWSGTCKQAVWRSILSLAIMKVLRVKESEIGQTHTDVGARLQDSIPCWVYSCALNTTRIGTRRPPPSGARSPDSPKPYETNVPQILPKAVQISWRRGWCGLPLNLRKANCICRMLKLREKWILQHITHLLTLPPFIVHISHHSNDGSNPTPSFTVSRTAGNVTNR